MKCIRPLGKPSPITRVSNEIAAKQVACGLSQYASKEEWKAEVRDVDRTPVVDDVSSSQAYSRPAETESSPELSGVRHDKKRSLKGKRRKQKGSLEETTHRIIKERMGVLTKLSAFDKGVTE